VRLLSLNLLAITDKALLQSKLHEFYLQSNDDGMKSGTGNSVVRFSQTAQNILHL
jgi:hypothetical protein